jgi:hypothetical protein
MTTGSGNVKNFLFTGTVNLAKLLESVHWNKKHETTTGSGNDILKFSLPLNQRDLASINVSDPH